jgi:hypothetical protein
MIQYLLGAELTTASVPLERQLWIFQSQRSGPGNRVFSGAPSTWWSLIVFLGAARGVMD